MAFAYPSELGTQGLHNFNTRRVHALELPWGNGLATARGLCKVYSALLEGRVGQVRELGVGVPTPVVDSVRPSVAQTVGLESGFLKEEAGMFSPHSEGFGHSGAGGALGWCDPKAHVAFGYVTSKMSPHVPAPPEPWPCVTQFTVASTTDLKASSWVRFNRRILFSRAWTSGHGRRW